MIPGVLVMALMVALKQNISLLHLDFGYNDFGSERAFFASAESLPEIRVLQRVYIRWGAGLASAMPLLLAGLRKNTSLLFCCYFDHCKNEFVPPTPEEKARCSGGWMQEMERLGVLKPLSHFDMCTESEARASSCLASGACPGSNTL
jgi:hypothetical protein